jgi:uncharacterized membrane protein
VKALLTKYKWYIIGSLILFFAALAVLMFLSAGPQRGAFIYQIH